MVSSCSRTTARTEAELQKLRDEIGDRYGQFPQSVENLFHYGRLRLAAEAMKVASVDRKGKEVLIRFSPDSRIDPPKVVKLIQKDSRYSLTPSGILRFQVEGEDVALLVDRVLASLEKVRA